MEAGLMTPIDPPPGLLDKMAEAIHADSCGCSQPPTWFEAGIARAAWDAMAEGLGLREALIFGRRHLVSDPLEPQP
jgi:hypothetical protein